MEIRDRVLVVEDDKRIGNFFRTVLEANHYDVIMAQTGAEAYSMVTSQCPDVVLADLKEHPGMVRHAGDRRIGQDP